MELLLASSQNYVLFKGKLPLYYPQGFSYKTISSPASLYLDFIFWGHLVCICKFITQKKGAFNKKRNIANCPSYVRCYLLKHCLLFSQYLVASLPNFSFPMVAGKGVNFKFSFPTLVFFSPSSLVCSKDLESSGPMHSSEILLHLPYNIYHILFLCESLILFMVNYLLFSSLSLWLRPWFLEIVSSYLIFLCQIPYIETGDSNTTYLIRLLCKSCKIVPHIKKSFSKSEHLLLFTGAYCLHMVMKKTPVCFQDQMRIPHPSTNKLNRVPSFPFFTSKAKVSHLSKWQVGDTDKEGRCRRASVPPFPLRHINLVASVTSSCS